MRNDNELILERLRGIAPNKGDWRDKLHPNNPNVPHANDNARPQPTSDSSC